jgi:TrmH family RNA methyltransferase
MKLFRSRDNAAFKALKRLATSTRERRKAGLTLLDGAHLIAAFQSAGGVPEQLIVSDARYGDAEIAAVAAATPEAGVLVLGDFLFNELAQVTTPTGMMALVRAPRPGAIPAQPERCVMLDNVQDAGNVGSILRSTTAAGIRTVLLSSGCAFAWSTKVLRAGMGAHFSLDIHENVDLAAVSGSLQARLVCTSSHAGKSLYQADLRGSIAWVFGNEGAGVSKALLNSAAELIYIPLAGNTESLNVAAAAAICLFEQVRQRSLNVDRP